MEKLPTGDNQWNNVRELIFAYSFNELIDENTKLREAVRYLATYGRENNIAWDKINEILK